MPLNIRNERVNQLAEELATKMHVNKTEAVLLALQGELRRHDEKLPLAARLKPLQAQIAALPDNDVVLDKAFFDELSGGY
jgi:antitoxin VapB